MLTRKCLLAFAIALIALASTRSARAQGLLYEVNTTSDTVVVGACANGLAGCSLRGAIQVANSHPGSDGILLVLPAGSVINLTQVLPDLTDSVSITGPGANMLTVRRNTGGNYRIFNVTTSGTVTFSKMTISNGRLDPGNGGGIANQNAGTVTVSNCTLSGNLVNSTNSGGAGGALFSFGLLNVTNSTLSGNSATGPLARGGGILTTAGGVNVTNCTLSGNSAAMGGAIYDDFGTVNVTNCTISGNSAVGPLSGGGGIFTNNNATINVKSSIIALNEADSLTDDVFQSAGMIASLGFNLIGNNTGATVSFPAGNPNGNQDIVGTNTSPIDPKLDPAGLQDNGGPTRTIALLPISPAIDQGTSSGLTGNLTTDQRGSGFVRTFDYPAIMNAPGGNGADIGAFELLTPFAVSRKIHGAFLFDIDLPLSGTAGVECRTGGMNGDHQLIVTFSFPVASIASSSVTTGTGSVSSVSVNGAQVVVNLTGVGNAQRIVLTLSGVSDGTNSVNVGVPMGLLPGDTTGNGSVNASDIGQTKAKSGQAVDASNFRTDVTVSGSINASDIGLVKTMAGTSLP